MKASDIKPGDRFRAEVTARGDGSYLSYEIDMSTAEMIEPAITPGQRAWDVWSRRCRIGGHMSWSSLTDDDKAEWEKIAEAARS